MGETFGERLQAERKRAGLTQVELASAVRVASSAITAWENDQRLPERSEALLLLSEVLGVSIDYLLKGKSPPGVDWLVEGIRNLLIDGEGIQRGTFAEPPPVHNVDLDAVQPAASSAKAKKRGAR